MVKERDQDTVLRLFLAGKSKAEVGKELGKDKKQVGKLLALAIREKSNDRPIR